MKKNTGKPAADPNIGHAKENFEIEKQKLYQRKIKTPQVEQQTLIHEGKKSPAKKKK